MQGVAQGVTQGVMQGVTVVDVLAIILSIVSLILTGVGFFASLKFYRDGFNMQSNANEALIKIEETTRNIQAQFGGVFDKALDAALGRDVLKENLQALSDQFEKAVAAQKQIGDAGIEERKRLLETVDEQMSLLSQRLKDTRETAEELTESSIVDIPMTRLQFQVLEVLTKSKTPLSRNEIARELGVSQGGIQNAFNKLMLSGLVRMDSCNNKIPRFAIRDKNSRVG